MQEISNNIRMSVHTFIKKVSDKHDIEFEELINMWENVDTDCVFQSPPKPVLKTKPKTEQLFQDQDTKDEETKKDKNIKSSSKVTDNTSSNGCPYVYTKGEKEGESCGIKPKGSVVYCTRHKKYEGQEPKQKKVVPCAKKSIAGNTPSKVLAPVAKEVNTVLRKNKVIDKLWHSATGMVFKSAKDRVVIGKFVDDKILSLTSDDINICMSHSFAYDESWKEDEVGEVITPSQVIENKKIKETNNIVTKKSISDAITEVNIKAYDIESILCEVQIDKKKSSSRDEDEELEDDEDDEDLLEEDD
jgi:hypothetical protein